MGFVIVEVCNSSSLFFFFFFREKEILIEFMVENFQLREGKGLESIQTSESSETKFHSLSDFLKHLATYVILCKCFTDCSDTVTKG